MRIFNVKRSSLFTIYVLTIGKIAFAQSGACEDKDDLFHWRNQGGFFEFSDVLNDCAFQQLADIGQADFKPKFSACVGRGLPYASGCLDCFTDLVQCTSEECIGDCISGSENQECRDCADLLCNPNFLTCGGGKMNPAECPECIKPLGEIIYFLPDAVTIVGAILISIFCCICLWTLCLKRRCSESEPVNEYEDKKDDIPYGHPVNTAKSNSKGSSKRSNATPLTMYSPKYIDEQSYVNSEKGLDFDQMTESPQFFRSGGRRHSPTGLTTVTRQVKQDEEHSIFDVSSRVETRSESPAVKSNTIPTAPAPPPGFKPVKIPDDDSNTSF